MLRIGSLQIRASRKELARNRFVDKQHDFFPPQVWVDSITEITSDDLSATDRDSDPESLEFILTPASNGHLALKSAPSRPVLNFTQAHIHSHQLVFVHSGEKMTLIFNNYRTLLILSKIMTLNLDTILPPQRRNAWWISFSGERRSQFCTEANVQHLRPNSGSQSGEEP